MKVSIITVTYNSEQYLKDCIDSVCRQSYGNIEHVIVDGRSTDGTIKLIESYGHLNFLSEPDNGIYDAMNKGLLLATGDIVGMLNSDDVLADDCVIERVVSAFQAAAQLEAVFADVVFVNRLETDKIVRKYSSRAFKTFMFKFGFQPAHPTFYVKKDTLDKYKMQYRSEFKIAGDFELLLRLLMIHRIRYQYIDDVWVKMRTGGVSTSGIKSIILLNSEIKKACNLNNVYTNAFFIYSKYLFKWWGFIFK